MRTLRFISFTTLVLSCLILPFGTASAQEKPNVPSRLALEVTYYAGRAPAFQVVPPADSKPGGSLYGMFGLIASWKQKAGTEPIQGVHVISNLEGDAVRVYVSTLSGAKALEKEEPVTSFLIRENEKVVVSELKQCGIEPFGIKLVTVAPPSLPLPSIDNRVESLTVVNTDVAYDSTLPTYKLTVVSQANKNIIALGIDVLADGRVALTGTRQNPEGQIFMAPGEYYQLKVGGVRRSQPVGEGYAPATAQNQQILIKGAVFEDGTYVGDPGIAVWVRATRAGEKFIIPKLLALLAEAISSADTDVVKGLKNLESQVTALSTDADPELVKSTAAGFPELKESQTAKVKEGIEFSATMAKYRLIKDLQSLGAGESRPADVSAFRELLGRARNRYEKWLAKL